MYHKAYGIIETLAPLHIGASAGEETGNLNLIFRDQFTQTGIIPGSSIRGRFRADMRLNQQGLENTWYGHEAVAKAQAVSTEDTTTEAFVKFEYASLVWLPVFCPGQPIVWVTCPRLLKRYQQITGQPSGNIPKPTGDPKQHPVKLAKHRDRLFFNLGFLDNLKDTSDLSDWVPQNSNLQPDNLVVIDDADMGVIHDMALYRQTRTKLKDDMKIVDNFFGFEALPEDSILIFPVAIKKSSKDEKLPPEDQKWQPLGNSNTSQLYFGGLESIGCGRCQVTLGGDYFTESSKGELE